MIKLTEQSAQELLEKGFVLLRNKGNWFMPPIGITFTIFEVQPEHDVEFGTDGAMINFKPILPEETKVVAAVEDEDEQLLKYKVRMKIAEEMTE